MDIVTREQVIQFIKQWADTHPGQDDIIKNSLGSSGSVWSGGYKDGVVAIIDGIVRSINEKAGEKLQEEIDKRVALRNKLNSQWQSAIESNFSAIKTALSKLGQTVTITGLEDLPE
jgi:ABC-type sulfate transport system substrate-binding protein